MGNAHVAVVAAWPFGLGQSRSRTCASTPRRAPLRCEDMSPEGFEVSTEETARALADGSAQVVDVREGYERDAGYVVGTEHIEMAQLAGSAEVLDPERAVIFQ